MDPSILPHLDSAEEAAVAKKEVLLALLKKRKHNHKIIPTKIHLEQQTRKRAPTHLPQEEGSEAQPIQISSVEEDDSIFLDNDVSMYHWAVVLENQRGFTLFSVPHYSCASLLPKDPPAFTVQGGEPGKPKFVTCLAEFTLPSPKWLWISKHWMVDMRGDGDVDVEGWEYNWAFRDHGWSPRVRSLSRGGWVRRRQWVRLMMKPAAVQLKQPPKVDEDSKEDLEDVSAVWRGDTQDFARCRRLMKSAGRDGRKLDMWRSWLSVIVSGDVASKGTTGSAREFEHMRAVLLENGRSILQMFVYPESRVRFLRLLEENKLEQAVPEEVVESVKQEFSSYDML